MATTNFVDYSQDTPIVAAWLNDVDAAVYETLPLKSTASDLAASTGPTLLGRVQPMANAVATTLDKELNFGLPVSIFEFLTTAEIADVQAGTRLINVAAKVNFALAACRTAKRPLIANAGDYELGTTQIAISTTNWLIGDGKDSTIFHSSYVGSAFLCSAWGGKLKGFTIYTYAANANGIEAGAMSRNCAIEDCYLQPRSAAGGGAGQGTGKGIYLNSGTGFSGGITISNTYCLAFKYGLYAQGIDNAGEDTWTTIQCFNFWAVGYAPSSVVVTGSAGMYFDAETNGIGSCWIGGTSEQFEYPAYFANDSSGAVLEIDVEGCTNNTPFFGNTFNGRFVSAFGNYRAQCIDSGTGYAWYRNQCKIGEGPINESYYATKQVLTSGNDTLGNIAWDTYHQDSLIDGAAVATYGRKFYVGVGQGGDYGPETHPSQHFLYLGGNKLHWGDNPETRTGSQAVVWAVGDRCFNLVLAVGQPKGWGCTVAGTSTTGGITTGTPTLVVASAGTFANGMYINVTGAGAAGVDLQTTISSGGGTTTLTLADNASTTVVAAATLSPGKWVSEGNL